MKLRLLSQWIRKRLIASRCRRKIGVRCKYKIRPDGLLAPEGESPTYSARQDLSYFTSWQRSAVVLPLACLRSGAEVHSAEGHNRRSPHSSSLARVETENFAQQERVTAARFAVSGFRWRTQEVRSESPVTPFTLCAHPVPDCRICRHPPYRRRARQNRRGVLLPDGTLAPEWRACICGLGGGRVHRRAR